MRYNLKMKGTHKANRRKVDTTAKNFKITVPNFGKSNEDNLGSKQVHNRTAFFSISKKPIHFKIKALCNTSRFTPSLPVPQFTPSSTNKSKGIDQEDERLDFEPEDEFCNNYNQQHENYCSSDASTLKWNSSTAEDLDHLSLVSPTGLSNLVFQEILSKKSCFTCRPIRSCERHDNTKKCYTNNEDKMSVSSKLIDDSATDDLGSSASHTGDMLPYDEHLDMSEDGRRRLYLRYIPSTTSRPSVIDSSSSSECDGNTNQYEMDEDKEDSSDAESDIGSDAENRLLESEDDESQTIDDTDSLKLDQSLPYEEKEEPNLVQQSVLQDMRCTTSGLNIIIQTKQTHRKHLNLQRDVERKARRRNKQITRFWPLRYEPYPATKLGLEDLGFTPPRRASSERSRSSGSDSSSVVSSHVQPVSTTSFKVTFNARQSSENRRCEQIEKCVSPQSCNFKIPLPPTKRPPTRPKRAGSTTSNGSSLESRPEEKIIIQLGQPKEDDVISISASSIGADLLDVKDESDDYYNDDSIPDVYAENSYVQNWVSSQGQVTAAPLMQKNSIIPPLFFHSNENEASARVYEVGRSSGGTRMKFKDVPIFFQGLCYYHFINEYCAKSFCKSPHFVNEHLFTKKLREQLSSDDVQSVYNFSLRFHILFKFMYPVLLKGFAYYKMQNSLIGSIDHFFELKDKINFTNAVECVVNGLQDTGLTFIEAIEKISFNVGFLRYPDLADVLLDILTQQPNISDYWEVTKQICRATNFIPHIYFERILSKLLFSSPNNKDLIRDIYNVIVKNKMTDLEKVDPQLLQPIKTLAEFGVEKTLGNNVGRYLSSERERFENVHASEPLEQILNDENIDSDDRCNFLFPAPIKIQEKSQRGLLSPSPSSPKSGRSSGSRQSRSSSSRHTGEHDSSGNNQEFFSPPKTNYQYVPQAVSQPSAPFTVTIPNRPPLVVDITVPPPQLPNIIQQNGGSTNISSPNSEINLFPDRPIFGRFKFEKQSFSDDVLHHLLPSSRDQVRMNDPDIINLHESILHTDGNEYLKLLDLYKGPTTLQHFITMSIADLKMRPESCNVFVDLLENIESIDPNFKRNRIYKGVLEVIAFNLILVFERKCRWQEARKLIEAFTDWDSLITSKQFGIKKLTPMGRYILLAKLLAKSNSFYYVYEILQSPDLNLLASPDTWPLFRLDNIDLEYRNLVLIDFFKFAYKHNCEVVCDMYRKIFQFGSIYQFDAHTYFNPMLETLINNEKTSLLKLFLNDITIFYKRMDMNILRGLIVFMESQFPDEYKLKLYEIGCQRGIYIQFTGKEPTIVVRTNMPDNELKLILHYYFHKLSLLHQYVVNHNLSIEIKLPDRIVNAPFILKNCLRSMKDVNDTVKAILFECFRLRTLESESTTIVEISKEELSKVVCRFGS